MKYFKVPVSAQMQRLPVHVLAVGGTDFQNPIQRTESFLNWQIFFTADGKGEFEAEDLKCTLTEKELIVIKPNVPHSYHAVGENWKTRWILFSGENIDRLMETLGFTENTLIKKFDSKTLEKKFYDIYNLCKQGYNAVTASHLLYTLLCEISGWKEKQAETLPCDAIMRAERYMIAHYDKCISIKEISAFSLVSSQYLCRLFKKYHNMRPFQYLNMLRVKKAQELLIQTDMEIREVAKKCCFESPSYFSKIFKIHVGLSPSKFVKYYKE